MKTKQLMSVMVLGATLLFTHKQVNAQIDWHVTGNAGTTAAQFMGTLDSMPLNIRTQNITRMHVNSSTPLATAGFVGIGTLAPTQRLHVLGNILSSGAVIAAGGNSAQWNAAFGWGNHAAAGYLTAETDPQVGVNAANYVPVWNGASLNTSGIYNSGSFFGLGTTTPIGSANFVVQSPNAAGYGGMYVNQTGANLLPFYGYAVNGGSSCWTYFDQATGNFNLYNSGVNFSVSNAGNVGIGITAPASKLHVVGTAASTSPVVQARSSYVGTADVRGVSAYSKPADGWGYGVEGTGGFRGGSFNGDGGAYVGSAYGVVGSASGTAGTRYGVYGSAFGGTENWGGYFPTKTYTSELRVGGTLGATGYVAAINGKLIATEVRVALTGAWPDYVFNEDYKLMNIHELEQSIKAENHLPGLPSACEVEDKGLHLGEMQTKIVEKLEESHLYIIQLQKQIDELKAQVNTLKK